MKNHVGIVGIGIYLPEGRMTAKEIADKTNGVWTEQNIIDKLGIVEKVVPLKMPDDGTQEMGALAALDALKKTKIDPLDIDVIISVTEEWKEYPLTTSALYVQDRIGAINAWGIDVQNRCCTTVSALKMAQDMLLADDEINIIMVVGGYRNGDFVDYSDRNMSMMYNLTAGGGAMILKKNHGENVLLGSHIIADGSLSRTAGVEIGGIPNAVAASLMDKKNLGIHTEMFTNGMMDLIKAGVITGSDKTFYKNRHVATFAYGSKELYEFINDNPSIYFMRGVEANDPCIIKKNDKQISINSTIEVDLTGQVASESIGHVQFSGTGGQSDTAVGARKSKGGKSFIALYSTAMVRNHNTGEREEISKIVPTLRVGANVTLSRNDVDYIVTEYGLVRLSGKTVSERTKLLISIAHPKFRDELTSEAKKLGFIV